MAIPMDDIATTTRLQSGGVGDIVFLCRVSFCPRHREAGDDSWCEDCEYSGEEPGCFA
jgi:hypothetical protein